MDYAAIRRELAARLENVDGVVAVYDAAPDRVVTPSIAVLPGEPFAEYHINHGGLIALLFDVVVFAQRFDTVAGQNVLDDLISAIPAAVVTDQSLAGTAQVVKVDSASNYGLVTVGDDTYLGCRFLIEVHAT